MSDERPFLELLAALGVQPRPVSDEVVARGLGELRAAFVEHLGEEIAQRFEVPQALQAWLRLTGGQAHAGTRADVLCLADMVRLSAHWMDIFAGNGPIEDDEPADGPWVMVASYGDKHWLFLCCDRAHPEWGHVAEGYDAVPWMDERDLDWDLHGSLRPSLLGAPRPAGERWTFDGMLGLLVD